METITQKSKTSEWFEEFIAQIRTDELLMNTSLINEEKKKVYNAMMDEDADTLMQLSHGMALRHFTKKIVDSYIYFIHNQKKLPNLIGASLGDKEVLIWCEIDDDDDETETNLFIAEAKTNAANIQTGMNISTTIVEKSDFIKMPKQYHLLYSHA